MYSMSKSVKRTVLFITIIFSLVIFTKLETILNDNNSVTNKPQSTIEKDLNKNNQDESQAIKFMSDLIKLTKQNEVDWKFYFNDNFDIAMYKCSPTKNSIVTIFCKEDASSNSVEVSTITGTRTTNMNINLPMEYRKNDIPKFTEYLKKKYGKETEMKFKNERIENDNVVVQFDNLVNTISKRAAIK